MLLYASGLFGVMWLVAKLSLHNLRRKIFSDIEDDWLEKAEVSKAAFKKADTELKELSLMFEAAAKRRQSCGMQRKIRSRMRGLSMKVVERFLERGRFWMMDRGGGGFTNKKRSPLASSPD